tara:strand:+ start:1173 stop:2156 length:984 start_codon:yes stop_codon:yes gene_type:complete
MANFITVPVKKYDGVDYTKSESAGYKTVGLSSDHVIYARDIETLVGATAQQTAADNSITLTAHGLKANDAIYFSAEIEPTNILADRVYFVKTVVSADKFSVTDTLGGSEQSIAGNDTVAANIFRVEAEVIYADTCTNTRPIKVTLNRGLIRLNHAAENAPALSKQFFVIDCNKKNGVSFSGTASNLVINTTRVILSYNTTNGGDDWNMFYDASKTNNAGFDSPFVHVLESETSINSSGVLEDFVEHIGALGGPENFESLTVNGNTVNFPDQSASGIVRLKNVVNAYESGSKSYLKLKGMGKGGFDTLIVNDTLANLVASTDATNIVE